MAKPNLATVPQASLAEELQGKSTAELRDLLAQQMRLTAEHLLRLAWIVRVLEERGEDLSDLRLGLLPYLRQIAYGQVVPEAVVRFASSPLLLSRVAALPEPEQRRLAAGEPVKLVVPGPNLEGYTHRLVDPARLSREQIAQVFARASLRGEGEQILVLESKRLKPAATPATPRRGNVRPDRARGGIVVGRLFVPLADVLDALADLRHPEGEAEDGERVTVPVSLSRDEHRRIKLAAVQGDTTMSELIRLALRASGLGAQGQH